SFLLSPLAVERVGEDFAGCAQQRDVIICPPLLALDRIEAQEADAISCAPQWNTEPGVDAAHCQPRFLLASWQRLNAGNIDAGMTVKPFGRPSRSYRQRAVRPANGGVDSFTTPTMGSGVHCIIGFMEDDIDAIHPHMTAQLLEPLQYSVACRIELRIDQ